MDRTSILVVVVCLALMLLWIFVLVPRLAPTEPMPTVVTNAVVAGQTPVTTNATQTATSASPATNVTAQIFVRPDAPEELLVVTNDNARYTFTSHGGGLKLVELVHYPETVSCYRKQASTTNKLATLNTAAPVPVLTLLGDAALYGDGVFTLTTNAMGVRAEKKLPNGLSLVKEFQLSSNYLITAFVRLENQSARPLSVPLQEWVVGTATPMGPLDNGQVVGVDWYNGTKSESVTEGWFANRTLGCFPGTPRTEYRGGASNVVWAAVHNQFFTLAVMTSTNEPASEVIVRRIDLPRPSKEEVAANSKTVAEPHGYQTSWLLPAMTLSANQKIERQFTLYVGPKEYRTLARIAAKFDNNLDLVMGFGGFFGFFAKALLLAMNWLHHGLGLAYGAAIIAITVIIKVVFWPLTKASTRSMKRMQALQPQMKALQDKYKDEPAKMQQKLMAFMKENKVSPLGGCLPMVLQIPVFFGFYTMIRSAIELRGAHFLWACDLSKPDTVFMIPGFNFPLNPLPLIMGATMLWQTSLTPVSPGMDPAQQKIMKYMPLMMVVFLYNFSAGLALYWTVQNLLTIAQMKLTKTSDPTPATVKPPAPVAPQKKKK